MDQKVKRSDRKLIHMIRFAIHMGRKANCAAINMDYGTIRMDR
jgi:hypothetical protein